MLPKPSMATLLTQNPASLDHDNRFFEDNKSKLQDMMMYDYTQEKPQYSDKKELASKVTKRQFIQMPTPDIRPPPGFRDCVVKRPHTNTAQRQSALKKQTRKVSKQVSEVGDQDSPKPKAAKTNESCNATGPATQVEEKMQKTEPVVEESKATAQITVPTDAHKIVRVEIVPVSQDAQVEVVPVVSTVPQFRPIQTCSEPTEDQQTNQVAKQEE